MVLGSRSQEDNDATEGKVGEDTESKRKKREEHTINSATID
jgi:hypothetical protein